MGLYLRGKTYWYSIKHQGKRIQESTGTRNRQLAEKIYAKILTEVIEGRYFDNIKAKRLTFAEMVSKYLLRHQKSRDLQTVKKLLPAFGSMIIADITSEMISDYRYERMQKVKSATVYQELSLMRRMFNVARREWKWLKDNPVADLSFSVGSKNGRDRWLTADEERRLLKCTTNPVWLRSFLMVALHTGMRRGEILALKWIDVDLKRRMVTVKRSKNGQKRAIPMSKTLLNVFLTMKVRDISGRVFPVAVRSVREAFRKALERSGIEDFRIHDLRHTFATRLVQNGVDLYRVKELLGHKSITMTMRYAHHYPESLRESVEVLDACYSYATVQSNTC